MLVIIAQYTIISNLNHSMNLICFLLRLVCAHIYQTNIDILQSHPLLEKQQRIVLKCFPTVFPMLGMHWRLSAAITL